ncbi:YccF domain-containing protein [Solitalea longa]|uniref:YccF domain-containing protein n=1 Tax=Solitalea longa TaxID=2079460 RepID=A0A2S5A493_9SPHI|nr:YccF domain-containing protein [Solitalea longa]POY37119.1 YccF domain-containing protein [Solitalea longa]
MNLIGNIIWLIFGGLAIFMEYLVSGFAMCCTIVGIPWGIQCFKLAFLALFPFGKKIRVTEGNPGCLSTLLNIIWFFIGGLWIALTHLGFGLLLAITIIGLPFAKQHFKLMGLSLTPFGREVYE